MEREQITVIVEEYDTIVDRYQFDTSNKLFFRIKKWEKEMRKNHTKRIQLF
jgi:hypothetical protein